MALGTFHATSRLTADPDFRFAATGKSVTKLRLASNSRRYDKEAGKWVDGDVDYRTAIAFGHLAENIAESLNKGDEVVVIGRLKQDNYTDKDGVEHKADLLIIDAIGPSLKTATARISRPSRRSDTSTSPTATAGDDPWAQPARTNDDVPPF